MDYLPVAMKGILTSPEIYADWLKEYQRIEDKKWRDIRRGFIIGGAIACSPVVFAFGGWFVMEVLVPLWKASF